MQMRSESIRIDALTKRLGKVSIGQLNSPFVMILVTDY
jgi:hypothetical protein